MANSRKSAKNAEKNSRSSARREERAFSSELVVEMLPPGQKNYSGAFYSDPLARRRRLRALKSALAVLFVLGLAGCSSLDDHG